MQQNKFSMPRHMSRSALPILFVNHFKKNWSDFFGLVILMFFVIDDLTLSQKIVYPLVFILFYLVLTGVMIYLRYYFFRFYVSDGNLVVQKGVVKKQSLNIPTYKIHSLRTRSGFFYRLFDMKGVAVDTLADKEAEVELILDDCDWDELLDMFKNDECTNVPDAVHPDAECNVNSFVFSNSDLLKGALCQNHLKGTVIMGVILLNVVMQLDDSMLSSAADYAVRISETISLTASSILLSIVILYGISLSLWLGKVLFRYYDMRLQVGNNNLFFESGLITRRSVRFAHDKLCTLRVKVNPLERFTHCSTVQMIQAFNVTDEKGQNEVLVYGCSYPDKFLRWWLGGDFRDKDDILTAHSGFGVFWYSIKFKVMALIAASLLLMNFGLYVFLLIPALLLPVYVTEGLLKTRRSRIVLKEDHIEVYNGSFASITYYLKYEDVENIMMRSTPFTSYTHRVHLMLSTNGTHLSIRSLHKEDARYVYEIILAKLHIAQE